MESKLIEKIDNLEKRINYLIDLIVCYREVDKKNEFEFHKSEVEKVIGEKITLKNLNIEKQKSYYALETDA